MLGCADKKPVKVPLRLFAEEFCSQSGCLFAQLALSAVPACLFKVMHAAVMAPFGSHIWPSVSVTVSGFFSLLSLPLRVRTQPADSRVLHGTLCFHGGEGLQGTRVSFLVWYQLTLFPLYCIKKTNFCSSSSLLFCISTPEAGRLFGNSCRVLITGDQQA